MGYIIEEIQQKGVYSGMVGRKLYHDVKYSKINEITNSIGDGLTEAIDYEFGKEEHGGIITFSTAVNAVELSPNKLVNWIKQKVKTLWNRLFKNRKIDKAAKGSGAAAWTVGHFLDGRYTSKKGKSFGEKSLSIEIVGITSQQLQNIAEDICRDFEQETVLVKDFITGKIYLCNREKDTTTIGEAMSKESVITTDTDKGWFGMSTIHDQLNDRIFDPQTRKPYPDVVEQIQTIVQDFLTDLRENGIPIEYIKTRLVGSKLSYIFLSNAMIASFLVGLAVLSSSIISLSFV